MTARASLLAVGALACAVVCTPAHASALSANLLPAVSDSIHGRVTDRTGDPIADVDVTVPTLSRRATTNAQGAFTLPDMPAGRFSLVFTRTGYASAVVEVDARSAGRVDVALKAVPFRLPDITVTASGSPITQPSSPLPATSLGTDQIRREHGVSLAHVLDHLAGVRTLSTGDQIGKPVIRGMSGARVRVLEDGMPLQDYSWSDEDGPAVDARLASRIEVVRGPASVLYGSDALGGVVNVISQPIPDATGRAPFRKGSIGIWAASNNLESGGVLSLEGASGSMGWRATGVGRFAGNLHTPAGELDNTGFFALNGDAAIGTRGDWGTAELHVVHYGGEFKLLESGGPSTGPTGQPEEGGPERKTDDERVEARANLPWGGSIVETRLQFQRHWLSELADEPGIGAVPGQEVTVFDLTLNTLTGEVLLRHDLGTRIHGTAGISGAIQHNATAGIVPVVPTANIGTGGLFALETLTLGALDLQGGARVDLRSVRADAVDSLAGGNADYTAFSGSAGAVLHLGGGLSFTANVGRAWRAPTLFELFSNGPRLGESRYEIGDTSLKPEAGLDTDVGLRWDPGFATVTVSAFHNRINDYIYLAPTADSINGLRVFRNLQADARLQGYEAQAHVATSSWLTLNGRLDFVRGTNLADRQPLPWIPPVRGDLGASFHGDNLGWARHADIGFDVEAVGTQDRLSPYDEPTAGYTLLHLDGGLDTTWHGRTVHIDLSVRNALDRSYRDFLSRYKTFALNPGRDIVLRVSTGL